MKKIFENLREILRNIGLLSMKLIREDAKKSIWQNNKSGGKYSQSYAEYKANNMRSKKTGDRLKNYKGISIISNSTIPDLHLTGRLFGGMNISEINELEKFVEISYSPNDIGKVLGALKAGRDIVNLNDKNKKIILEYLKNNLKFSNRNKNIEIKIKL